MPEASARKCGTGGMRGKTLTSGRHEKMWNRWDVRENIKPVVGAGKCGTGGMRGKTLASDRHAKM